MKESIVFKVQTCASCGVIFALTKAHADALRENHGGFYCPNGHSLVFGEEDDELTKQSDPDPKGKSQP